MLSRRDLLLAGVTTVAFRNDTLNLVEGLLGRFSAEAEDEDFWAQIQQAFTLDRNTVNFNNGGCSPSPRVVQETLRRQLELSNQAPSNYMWRILEPEIESVRLRLAKVFGCDAEELAITRNASESLETLLLGFDLHAGDEVVTTNFDYPRMITTLQQRERRDGIKMVQARVPAVPRSHDELLSPIAAAVTDRTKVILVSQVSFLNGQIFPVQQVVEFGHKRGIPVVVDGAHAFVQFAFDRDDLGCDFYGTSLHKWLMAPIGTGFLYVRKDRIKDVWSLMASTKEQTDNIRKFEEIGTHPAANHNAIGEAITFHEMLGMKRKEARLRYLRRRWTSRLEGVQGVRFYTNLDPKHSCAITTLGLERVETPKLAEWLLAKNGIFVTTIKTDSVDGIRVTPNVYSTVQEIDRFAEAMLVASSKGIV